MRFRMARAMECWLLQQIPIELVFPVNQAPSKNGSTREYPFGVREQSSRFQSGGKPLHFISITSFIPVPPEIATVIAGSTFGIVPNVRVPK